MEKMSILFISKNKLTHGEFEGAMMETETRGPTLLPAYRPYASLGLRVVSVPGTVLRD